MAKSKNKKISHKTKNSQLLLKVFCFTPIAKPLNGSLPRSNASHMLRLDSVNYSYTNGKEEKKATATTYLLKGIKGVLRHTISRVCLEAGMEVCHSTDKETDKHGNRLLPKGFHLLGSCKNNGECIIHQIFGSKSNQGILSVYSDPIASISHKTAKLDEKIQRVHIATENRVNLTYEGKSIQDFAERYFSGYFSFEINVKKCNPQQLGLIIQGAMNFDRLGRGYNTGYGNVEVKKIQLLKRKIKKIPVWSDEDSFVIKKEITEKSLRNEFEKALEVWNNGFGS